MKLKYILGFVLSAFLTTACTDEDDVLGTFDDLSVSQSFITFSEDGSDATVTIKAKGDWKFDEIFSTTTKDGDGNSVTTYSALPNWLHADILSGGAGETQVSMYADPTSGGRQAELHIVSGHHTQFLMVRQGSLEATSATCAQVIAGADGKTFRVKGTVTKIANTTYGNWYLDDGTGEIYIYGTLDQEGKTKNFTSLGLEVGDVVEIEGPKTTYNGTVELVDVTVLSIKKSLLKVASTDPATVKKEGGEVNVKVACKGNGAYVSVPEDADWVKYLDSKYQSAAEADTIIFRFSVAPNEGNSRETTLKFTSANGSSSSEATYTIKQEGVVLIQPKGDGTEANPFNVIAALNYTKALDKDVDSEKDVYVEGIISSIKFSYTANFGTATYNISDDGKEENVFTVYGSYFFNNQPWQEGQAQIAVGDKVLVCGKVIYYNGTTPEFSNKKNWLVTLNGKGADGEDTGGDTGGDSGDAGTLENPFTPAQADAFVRQMEVGKESEKDYYVKGRIISIADKDQFGTAFGNCTFYISDDGTDKDEKFYIFRTLYMGNVKYTDESWRKPVAGDEVVICGKLVLYSKNNDLIPETAANKSYIYSLNGQTE